LLSNWWKSNKYCWFLSLKDLFMCEKSLTN
jgi:hypothetical protein